MCVAAVADDDDDAVGNGAGLAFFFFLTKRNTFERSVNAGDETTFSAEPEYARRDSS